MLVKPLAAPDKFFVLGKATTRAASELSLSNAALSRVIGLSEPSISRVASGARGIDQNPRKASLHCWSYVSFGLWIHWLDQTLKSVWPGCEATTSP